MKILFCNKYNYRFSGTESYLFDVMELLRQQGHETALFSMADPRGEATAYDAMFVPHLEFKSPAGPIRRARLAAHAIYSIGARKRLRSLIEQFRPDVAHVRNIYHHLSPSILWELRARKVPVVYHVNDLKLVCPSYNAVCKGSACELCAGGRSGTSSPPDATWALGSNPLSSPPKPMCTAGCARTRNVSTSFSRPVSSCAQG